jgi:hypothetical protein
MAVPEAGQKEEASGPPSLTSCLCNEEEVSDPPRRVCLPPAASGRPSRVSTYPQVPFSCRTLAPVQPLPRRTSFMSRRRPRVPCPLSRPLAETLDCPRRPPSGAAIARPRSLPFSLSWPAEPASPPVVVPRPLASALFHEKIELHGSSRGLRVVLPPGDRISRSETSRCMHLVELASNAPGCSLDSSVLLRTAHPAACVERDGYLS